MYYKSLYYTWFINNNLNVPQVAQQLQARLNVQMSISEDLQRKFNDISNAPEDDSDNATVTSPARKRCRTDNPDDDDLEEAEKDEVKHLARHFVIMHGPWLKQKLIFQVELVDDEDYDEKERFKDTNTMVQGQLREIRGLLPEKYLEDSFMAKWLSKSVSNVCFLYKCTNCSISSSREWTHNAPTLLHASGNLPPPYSASTHWI